MDEMRWDKERRGEDQKRWRAEGGLQQDMALTLIRGDSERMGASWDVIDGRDTLWRFVILPMVNYLLSSSLPSSPLLF